MALEAASGGAEATTEGFRRLLGAAGEDESARVQVLMALARRQVALVMRTGTGRSRTLTNGDGETAMPIFTGTDLQVEVARRFGWMDANGACEVRIVPGADAFRMAVLQDVHFVVVDITYEHAAEFSREEIEAALASPPQGQGRSASAAQTEQEVRQAVRRSTRPPGGVQGFEPHASVPRAPRVPVAVDEPFAQAPARVQRDAAPRGLAELDDPFASGPRPRSPRRNEAPAAMAPPAPAPEPPVAAPAAPVPPPAAPVPPPAPGSFEARVATGGTPTGDAAGFDYGAAHDTAPGPPSFDAPAVPPPEAPALDFDAPPLPDVGAPAFGHEAPLAPSPQQTPPAWAPPDLGGPALELDVQPAPSAQGTPAAWSAPDLGNPSAEANPEALQAAALVTQVARESGDADALEAAAELTDMLKQSALGQDAEPPAAPSQAASALAQIFTSQSADGKPTRAAPVVTPVGGASSASADEGVLGTIVGDNAVAAGVKSAARTLIGMFKKGEGADQPADEPQLAEASPPEEVEYEPGDLRPPEAPLGDEVFEALSATLKAYLEVEWACQCSDGSTRPVLGVRVDPSFNQRVGEIEAALTRAAGKQGFAATVTILTDPVQMRQARKVGTVFHPFRRKPKTQD